MGVFVAGMGASGLALARRAGLEPLGLVYGVVNRVSASGGVSVIGEQRRSMEAHLDALHAALQRMTEQARRLALAGVEAETKQADASGVVGLQVGRRLHRSGTNSLLAEFQATGTAIAALGRASALAPAAVAIDVAEAAPTKPRSTARAAGSARGTS